MLKKIKKVIAFALALTMLDVYKRQAIKYLAGITEGNPMLIQAYVQMILAHVFAEMPMVDKSTVEMCIRDRFSTFLKELVNTGHIKISTGPGT